MKAVWKVLLYLAVVAPAIVSLPMLCRVLNAHKQVAEMKGRLSELSATYTNLCARNNLLGGQIRDAEELKNWEARLESRRANLSNEVATAEARERDAVKHAEDAEAREREANRRANETEKRAQTAEERVNKAENQYAYFQGVLPGLRASVSDLEKEQESLTNKVAKLVAERDDLSKAVGLLQRDQKAEMAALQEQKKKVERLQQESRNLDGEKNQLEVKVKELKDAWARLQVQTEEAEKLANKACSQMRATNDELAQTEEQLRTDKEELSRLEKRLSALGEMASDLEKLKSQKRRLEEAVADLSEEKRLLGESLEQLRQESGKVLAGLHESVSNLNASVSAANQSRQEK